MTPSKEYWKVIEDGKRHHRGAKTWSGGLAVRHGRRIKAMIDRLGAKSVLDYGCGKGQQYHHEFDGQKLEAFWGVPVTKYDPALPSDWYEQRLPKFEKFAPVHVLTTLPEGQTWDLLVCTHVLGCIPPADLTGWVIPLFHRIIKKGMYFAENLQPATKKVVKDEELKAALARSWGPKEWVEVVTLDGGSNLDTEFWFRGHDPERLGARFEKWPFDPTVYTVLR